jgi:hypothetical protein
MNDLTLAALRHRAEPCGPHLLHRRAVVQAEQAGSRLGERLRCGPATADICVGRAPKAGSVLPGHAEPAGLATDTHQSAQRAMLAWRRMEESVAPVIGAGGVCAIYRRSLACARRAYPWLPVVHGSSCSRIELASLCEALARQPASEASSADAMLQQTFGELLASLVGSRLANRLLGLSFEASVGNQRRGENVA